MVKTSQLIDGDHGKSSSQESMEYFRHNVTEAKGMGFPILEKPLLNLERLVFRWQVKLEFNHLETDRPLALVI